ncbi:hypothetical protein ACE1CI_33105 [Aerosakkonemataceae cyanobacterium BLCC-F50]|uniref:Uncharacterized protein n=1 Tax=Floridaenema flaviceps BLCC-F50 TaxID=3153642 RepID=A0ABV4Y1G1_9CYAN
MENQPELLPVTNHELASIMPDIVERYMTIRAFAQSVLQPGIDYAKIPGTGDKNTLLLPGAQKLRDFFNLTVQFHLEERIEDWTGKNYQGEPFFFYLTRADVYRNNRLIATAYGSCNSWEKKYRWREAKRHCPNCGSDAIRKSKNSGEGWYCWGKIGGCGAKFTESDERITNQKVGLEPNPEIFDLPNTLLKMSNKRAFVSAILYATGLSETLTSDLEDFVAEEEFSNLAAPAPKTTPHEQQENSQELESLISQIRTKINSRRWSIEQAKKFLLSKTGKDHTKDMNLEELNKVLVALKS